MGGGHRGEVVAALVFVGSVKVVEMVVEVVLVGVRRSVKKSQ